ncbi:LolA family protein [Coprobacter tertius]|uniref:Outer-membrane lipoprotein carrier protein LolA n=1 Tax=Coprobacter tertius TaxID=2944915 RepID=A0ABT1MJ29_9BACT|nr:LolA-like putative outer membrane lipoprotein chaperone [Coprobacter tertius]MCP9611708.1 outer-membrane lipoprotein carrier protein LolA [Coprobacter tertius]
MNKSIQLLLASILLCVFIYPVKAQQVNKAIKLLDQVAANYEKAKGISAHFDITTMNSAGKQEGTVNGNIQMLGKQYAFSTSEMITWYNGTTQWTYIPSNNEVNVSTPSEEEIQSINPYLLLKGYKNNFNCIYKGKNKTNENIELIPKDNSNEIKKIILYIDVNKYLPVNIIIENKNKTKIRIGVSQIKTGLNFKNSQFVFDKKKYPDTEIIDLR